MNAGKPLCAEWFLSSGNHYQQAMHFQPTKYFPQVMLRLRAEHLPLKSINRNLQLRSTYIPVITWRVIAIQFSQKVPTIVAILQLKSRFRIEIESAIELDLPNGKATGVALEASPRNMSPFPP